MDVGNKEQEGPRLTTTRSYRTCNGCIHFESRGIVFGHNFREDETSCKHPKAMDGQFVERSFHYPNSGRIINYRTKSHENHVPDWCPFIKK